MTDLNIDRGSAAQAKGFACEVKQSGDHALDFTISTASVDRMGDTIAVDGWKLDRFLKNPVVLWAHDSGELPVGKASNVRIDGGALKASVEFTPPGVVSRNDQILELYKGGFLNATSVGFLPIKWNFAEDPARKMGIDFIEQELLEFSLVPIPANPDALIQGKFVDLIADQAESIAARKDLFADAFARRVADAAGVPVMTQDRQRWIADLERQETVKRLRRKRERDLALMQLRG